MQGVESTSFPVEGFAGMGRTLHEQGNELARKGFSTCLQECWWHRVRAWCTSALEFSQALLNVPNGGERLRLGEIPWIIFRMGGTPTKVMARNRLAGFYGCKLIHPDLLTILKVFGKGTIGLVQCNMGRGLEDP